MTNPAPDLKSIERTLAYEMASSLLDSECLSVDVAESGSEVEAVWLDLTSVSGEVDVYDAVAYLNSRRLLRYHADSPQLALVLDEDEPLPEPETAQGIICTPVGLQTPEGIERVNAALEANKGAAINVANAAADLVRDFAFELQELTVEYPEFGNALKGLSELCDARDAAKDEMLRAISGYPKAGA